ncbi:Ubiquinone/menaquinone biosynthesis C-methylase UbiE [Nakamurella panacisegetis]|uniref:Ubiquinone/menaquinone biosynthesis C-methylase UbiE n=1 Tax=Nakamurella panacisegetis TaxID=1090615 RepID=A0A1H0JC65_9ACTN|nr:class I SAM-dependent methyltransferase [Nakamurella panacisegetis]SDO40931.1 Ubiquinone/menaquinone biosynthesis C-methylase UbiE [Nakamurella panacisegetis]
MTNDETNRTRAAFDVPATAYQKLIGRYLGTLAPAFADAAGVVGGLRVLDVGCGPGGLTRELARRAGPAAVSALDPSESFVQACAAANPGVDVRLGVAEELPFEDATFDVTLASLVVGFMTDPIAGVREMARVTRPGGTVALCFWNYAEMPLLRTLFTTAARFDPAQGAEDRRLGTRDGELVSVLRAAGVADPHQQIIQATAEYDGFDDWWSPVPLGVGPMGLFYRSLDEVQREQWRELARDALGAPDGPFRSTAQAWCACGTV